MADEIEKKVNRDGARIRPLKLTFPTDAGKPTIEEIIDAPGDLPEETLSSKEITSPSLSEEAIPSSPSQEVLLSSLPPKIFPSSITSEFFPDSSSPEVPSPSFSPEILSSSISPEILSRSLSMDIPAPSISAEVLPRSLTYEDKIKSFKEDDKEEDGSTAFPRLSSSKQETVQIKKSEQTREDAEDKNGMMDFSPPPFSPKQEIPSDKDKKAEKIRVPLGRIALSDMDGLFSSRVHDSSESDMPFHPDDHLSVSSPAFAITSITSSDATTAASATRPPLRRIPASRHVSEKDLISAESEAASKEMYTEEVRTIAVPVPKVPLRFKTLNEAMDNLRDLHPLPTETLFAQESYQFTWLSTQIRKIVTKRELQEFAYDLTQRDLSLLFSTLSQLKKREETEPVQNLIRLRAGHCLYLYGWITFQYCYPRSTLARALADLCKILEDISFVKENAQDDDHGKNRASDNVKNRMDLPEIDIGEGRVIWSRVPLISGIAFPNSRHFISDIANHIFESNISLEVFFRRYAIYPGLPLSDAIESRYKEKVTGDSQNPFLSSTFFDRFRS